MREMKCTNRKLYRTEKAETQDKEDFCWVTTCWSSKRKETNGARHTIRYSTIDVHEINGSRITARRATEISPTSNLTKHFNAWKLYFVCCYFRLCLSNTLCNVRKGCGILCNFARILYLYHVMFTIRKKFQLLWRCVRRGYYKRENLTFHQKTLRALFHSLLLL